jgi:hypothetical protein
MAAKDIDPRSRIARTPAPAHRKAHPLPRRFEFNAPKFHDFTIDDAPESPGAFFTDGAFARFIRLPPPR